MTDHPADLGRAVDSRGGYTRTIVEDHSPVSAAQFEAGIDMVLARIGQLAEQRDQAIQAAVRKGVESGIRSAMSDRELITDFWRDGFDELTKHGSNGASQWVGKRILTSAVVAVLVVCVAWLAQAGRLK